MKTLITLFLSIVFTVAANNASANEVRIHCRSENSLPRRVTNLYIGLRRGADNHIIGNMAQISQLFEDRHGNEIPNSDLNQHTSNVSSRLYCEDGFPLFCYPNGIILNGNSIDFRGSVTTGLVFEIFINQNGGLAPQYRALPAAYSNGRGDVAMLFNSDSYFWHVQDLGNPQRAFDEVNVALYSNYCVVDSGRLESLF